jgi:hypothetical protein
MNDNDKNDNQPPTNDIIKGDAPVGQEKETLDPPPNCPLAAKKKTPINEVKKRIMAFAETFDALRVIPRIILVLYGILVYSLYSWFLSIPTLNHVKCDAALLKILLDSGESLQSAQTLACSIVDVTGGPTTAQAAFVTVIVGLAPVVVGLYQATGRKWEKNQSS